MSIEESRRRFLQTSGLGIGWLAAFDLFERSAAAAPSDPLAPKSPPMPATAKRVISLFMQGGPSQVDTFDPKPLLNKLHGQHPTASFGDEDFQNGKFKDLFILGSKRTFQKHGQSGIEVSDLLPHIAGKVDDIAVIRSCYHEGFTHSQAQFLINNGWPRIGRPSLGSWILYGLGSENQNLPGFVVLLEGGIRSGDGVRPGVSSGRLPGNVIPTRAESNP
jgi:hypothetical protein